MSKPQPITDRVAIFLKGNLGKKCLAPLTGTDYRALMAGALIIEAYSGDRNRDYLDAFRLVVSRMQRKCWPLAFHTIACLTNWEERMTIWMKAGLPTAPLENMPVCEMDPEARLSRHNAAAETQSLLDPRVPPAGYAIVTQGTTNAGDLVWNRTDRKWESVDAINEYLSEYLAVARPIA